MNDPVRLQIVYHSVMAAVWAVAVVRLWRRPTGWSWLRLGAAIGLAAGGLAAAFDIEDFLGIRLLAYGLFGYCLAWLWVSAALVWRSARRTALTSAALGLVGAAVAVDAFLVEPYWLDVSHYEFHSPKLERRLRVVVLADIQTDVYSEYLENALRRAMAQRPDLLLWAGDYLQAAPEVRRELAYRLNGFLRELPMQAPLGVFAVKGNIDRSDWKQMFAGLEVRTIDETESFELGGIQLTCLSCADSFRIDPDLPETPPGRFHLVLGHAPVYALGSGKADLMLAGHTHAGQVRMPLLGPVTTMSIVPRRYGGGLAQRPAGGQLLVSRGVGLERSHAPRLRFLCRPELVVIDLLPEK